ncbi:MAG TPA: alpha/beta hydrolase [Candidatus Eisenbacteria bacterium]|nr:alpha/beta hydrolase [Candidatus Eisenbacteria bacterium]
MPTANPDGLTLYYEQEGDGAPVLLVPPSWWPCDTWKVSAVPALRDRYRTIVFDCRGTGRSGRPEEGYSVEQFAHDALGLLACLAISRCHVVGFALGGQIAQAMAIQAPETVATLTMAATGPGNRSLSGEARAQNRDAEAIEESGFETFIRSHIDNDRSAFSAEFYRTRHDVVAALADALWAEQAGPKYFQYHHNARRTWDTLAQAAHVRVPTLILVGSDDHASRGGSTPLATGQRLAELTPGAELALLPGVKHMTFWDGNAGIAKLRDFLARHPL